MVGEPARVAWRSDHDWVLPKRAVQTILAGALLFLFLGLVLLAVGGGVQVGGLVSAGAVLAGIGGCGLLVCLLLCLHAYFIFNVRDQAIQTPEFPWSDNVHSTQDIPGYAIVNKPSALKSESLRRNGNNGGVKKVTMAPDVALDADVRAPALQTTSGDFTQMRMSPATPDLALASPASPGYRTLGSYAVTDASGMSKGQKASGVSAMESFDQRSYAQQQQFQDIQQQKLKHQASQQAVERQRTDMDIQQKRQQLELHRQHLMQQQHRQQQQPHHFRVQVQQPSQSQSVTYAQIQRFPIPMQHSPSPSMSSQQSSVFTSATGSLSGGAGGGGSGFTAVGTGSNIGGGGGYGAGMGTGSSLGTAQTSSSFSSYKIRTQGLQYQSGRSYMEDDDYDNPAEGMPILAQSSLTTSAKGVSFSGSGHNNEAEVPEPAPLQYPSERRPMTFEQQSSSKMSIYDNVLFPYAEAEGE